MRLTKFSLGILFAACSTQLAFGARPKIAGLYESQYTAVKMKISASNRILNGFSPGDAVIKFPTPLRWNGRSYTGQGLYERYVPTNGMGNVFCRLAASIEISPDSDGEYIDVTITYPKQIGITMNGRCIAYGSWTNTDLMKRK